MEQKKESRKAQKAKRWTRKRHRICSESTRIPLSIASRLMYGYRRSGIDIPSPTGERQDRRQMLILYNHQTPFDQFYIGITFHRAVYYLASEDIFSNGFTSKLLKWAVNPIPIDKSKTDIRAIGILSKVAREGGSIAIAPEGNRTYSGATGHMKPSIVPLARKLHLPIALFRIEGGYSVQPRFADKRRKGKTTAKVVNVIEPEAYEKMTDGELYEAITSALDVREPNEKTVVKGRRLAEYLERAIYFCPNCRIANLESKGVVTRCPACDLAVTHHPDGSLTEGEKPFVFPNVLAWYRAQEDYISSLDGEAFSRVRVAPDRVRVFRVQICKRKIPIARDAMLSLFSDRIELTVNGEKEVYPFDPNGVRSFSILGRNKLNFRVKRGEEDMLLQCRGDKRFNALKYLHFFTHAQNLRFAQTDPTKEEKTIDGHEFLGL